MYQELSPVLAGRHEESQRVLFNPKRRKEFTKYAKILGSKKSQLNITGRSETKINNITNLATNTATLDTMFTYLNS